METQLNLEKLKFPIGKFEKPISISESDLKNWIETIELFPSHLKNLTNTLSIEELNWKYRPDGWAIKQVIHHCADSHMNSFIRFKLALTENVPTIKPYEEGKWAELIDSLDGCISNSIAIIEGLHYRWVLLLKTFTSKELSRQFMHPESKVLYTLKEVIGLYAWHCNHHLAHIEQGLFYKGQFNK
jgi:DinB superfamily